MKASHGRHMPKEGIRKTGRKTACLTVKSERITNPAYSQSNSGKVIAACVSADGQSRRASGSLLRRRQSPVLSTRP